VQAGKSLPFVNFLHWHSLCSSLLEPARSHAGCWTRNARRIALRHQLEQVVYLRTNGVLNMAAKKRSTTRKAPARKKATRAKASTRKSTRAKAAPASSTNAIKILRADHKLVNELFEQFEGTRSSAKKMKLVQQICTELTIHAMVEEEIFYPAVKKALKDDELVPEAVVEHDTLKGLIAQVEGVEPHGEMYDAKVKVMSEYVKHHVKEEQNEMFPKAQKTRLDMDELGSLILQRKEELMAELG
jgi:hemerythrin superfamily protein